MGWPLAVAAGLMEQSGRALVRALGLLALGHLAAMALAIAPFSLLSATPDWQRPLQLASGLLLFGWGGYLLLNPRHPRILARIRPTRLALWSFVVATAHGAGLMLVPIYLGLCQAGAPASAADEATALAAGNMQLALAVSLVHAIAVVAAGGLLAVAVYRVLGLKFLTRAWINLDAVWAASLVVVGAFSIVLTLRG